MSDHKALNKIFSNNLLHSLKILKVREFALFVVYVCGIYISVHKENYMSLYIKKIEMLRHTHRNTPTAVSNNTAVKLLVYFPCRFVGRINVYHDRNEPIAR